MKIIVGLLLTTVPMGGLFMLRQDADEVDEVGRALQQDVGPTAQAAQEFFRQAQETINRGLQEQEQLRQQVTGLQEQLRRQQEEEGSRWRELVEEQRREQEATPQSRPQGIPAAGVTVEEAWVRVSNPTSKVYLVRYIMVDPWGQPEPPRVLRFEPGSEASFLLRFVRHSDRVARANLELEGYNRVDPATGQPLGLPAIRETRPLDFTNWYGSEVRVTLR